MVEDLEKNPATLGERENTVQRLIETNPATRALKEKKSKTEKKKNLTLHFYRKNIFLVRLRKKKKVSCMD